MEKKIILDMLTEDKVSVIKQNCTAINEIEYLIGEPSRTSYINSDRGREILKTEVAEPYLSAILAMWGDSPTVTEETV